MMFSKIIVPLDGSPVAEAALPYAGALAEAAGLPVELLSVIDLADFRQQVDAERGLFIDTLDDFATHRRQDYLTGLAKTLAGLRVTWCVDRGASASAIVEHAADDKNSIIVMASHGRSGLQRWLLGSVAEKVLRATANPLMLVRATEATSSAAGKRLGPIIVPLDGSSVAELVLPTVTELAKSLASEVILFRAYNVPYGGYSVGGGSYAVDLPRLSAAVEADVQQYLEERRANLAAAGVAQLSFASKEGLAADAIIDYARNHHNGLIVMCSHGRTGVQRWALGSVTEAVARHAGNPVLILHAAS